MSITIKDIAKLAKVSHTTVSRALNNSPLINEETKRRIKEIAAQLNYVPNYSAKSLVLDKSYTIGLFFSTISQGTSPSFFYEIVRGVSSVIRENYNLVVRGIDEYDDFSAVNSKRFDGIILMSQSDNDNKFIAHVLQQEIPLVVINREIESKSLINITSDDKDGAYKAVNYLIENGHKKIGIIEGIEQFRSSKNRKDGFMKALLSQNIHPCDDYMVKGAYDMKSGYKAMEKLLELKDMPTAVFCSNDDMAIGAMKAILKKGLLIPQDVSIVGFDGIGFSEYANPSLTTVKKPMEKISIVGAQKMIDILDKKDCKNEKIFIETQLIVRESVADIGNCTNK